MGVRRAPLLPDSPFTCVINPSRFIVGVLIRRPMLAVSTTRSEQAGKIVQELTR